MCNKKILQFNIKMLICLICALLLIVVGTCFVVETAAKYQSFGKTDIDVPAAKWNVILKSGTQELSKNFDIAFKPTDKSHVANDRIAPSCIASSAIVLDLNGTEVSVDYNITADMRAIEALGGKNIELAVFIASSDNVKHPVDLGRDNCILLQNGRLPSGLYGIYFELNWKNEDTDGTFDTRYALFNRVLSVPVSIKIKQHLGTHAETERLVVQNISYIESLDFKQRQKQPDEYTFNDQDVLSENPERGFYSTSYLKLTPSGLHSGTTVITKSNTSKLLFVKVDLTDFSGTMNGTGTDLELSSQAIQAFADTLKAIKQNDNTVILRFTYDNNAGAEIPGVSKAEPAQTMIEKHIEQLGDTFKAYSSTINAIQIGFYGLWGECYYNTDVQSHPEYFKTTTEKLLAATSGTDITIALRKPRYYAKYQNITNIADIDNEIYVTTSTQDAYRVGIFNDALGGNATDLDTYTNRAKETAWLSHQSMHTFCGGEAIPEDDKPNGVGDFNTADYFITESFKIHTSYLNWEWNQALHKQWATQLYMGDPFYGGRVALTYIENHLGYRLVLKESKTYATVTNGENLPIEITVNNVGFSNIIKPKQADIIITDGSGVVKATFENVNIDAKAFLSQISIKQYTELYITGFAAGNYNVYLRLSSGEVLDSGKYYSAIRFANASTSYDANLQANHIASFTVE